MIHCSEWPTVVRSRRKNESGAHNRDSTNNVPVNSIFDVLKLVQDWHLEYQRGPLVVVDE